MEIFDFYILFLYFFFIYLFFFIDFFNPFILFESFIYLSFFLFSYFLLHISNNSAATSPQGPTLTKIQTLYGPIFCSNIHLIQTPFRLIWKIQTKATLELVHRCNQWASAPSFNGMVFFLYFYWYRTVRGAFAIENVTNCGKSQ